ncbi:MAG: hypothetical protein GDA43_08510 [Hormoscilla sp. SP5CHS1]|nr:hypothetical protein [Hormoscilla sp. SP5CHS1]
MFSSFLCQGDIRFFILIDPFTQAQAQQIVILGRRSPAESVRTECCCCDRRCSDVII